MSEPIGSGSSRDQLLTLKVMRLTRPTFNKNVTVGLDPGLENEQTTKAQIGSNDLDPAALMKSLRLHNGQTDMTQTIGNSLLLPQNFENIYLGETFTCYVCVHNESQQTVTQVSVKADLQTTSQRVSLASKYHDGVDQLEPAASLGQIISHEVKEIGQHILVCAVQYSTANGEKMYFRKFFKFPVSKPLDVRTKFYNAEDNLVSMIFQSIHFLYKTQRDGNSDDVYLEAQLQNTTTLPMVMEKVTLEPAELYVAHPINSLINPVTKIEQSVFHNFPYLNPQDIRQYLFRLSPKPGIPPKNFRGVSSIGKLDMVWRTSLGERGRLQTSPLQRMAPGYGDLRLTIESTPSRVDMSKLFTIVCRLHNACDRALDIELSLEGDLQPNLVWCSTSGVKLGEIKANGHIDLELKLLAVSPGLHYISGIRLTDTFLNRTYEHDEIAQIFVNS